MGQEGRSISTRGVYSAFEASTGIAIRIDSLLGCPESGMTDELVIF